MAGEDFTALVAVIVIFGFPVAAFVISRALAHQERLEMIRRGMSPPPDMRAYRRAMRDGWMAGAPQQQQPQNGFDYGGYAAYQAQRHLRGGLTVALVGLALLIGLSFIGYDNGRWTPGPWLLGGLIPLFVGIAQILIAMMSGAQFGVLQSGPAQMGPPPTNAPGQPSQSAAPAGPFGYRPGPTTPLERPSPPPDLRS
ncbi:MAG: hypothetical protein JOZ38_07220 [Candidatus Eremiobacteraeota bacterium]|nr:hypothetical protein [Candidatus Eremiobacteraeota bacterium]